MHQRDISVAFKRDKRDEYKMHRMDATEYSKSEEIIDKIGVSKMTRKE